MKKSFFLISGLLLTLVLAACGEREPSKYDVFAKCLTDNSFTMYGTEWCKFCKKQKEMFGASFDLVDYVDCDIQKETCQAAGITGYPTWVTASGEKLSGAQSLVTLAKKANCELPKQENN